MVIHTMKIAAAPFEKIVSGNKIIESRLYDEKRQRVNPGDHIEFTCSDEPARKVMTIVSALYRYPNFEKMFSDFPSILFGGASREGLIEEIENFYPKREQNKYGVIGIKIEVVK